MTEVRSQPCSSCPYRRDVPSGVWSAAEYEKLAEYDRPTADQPLSYFACHATPDHVCSGWASVHGNEPGYELLGLRLIGSPVVPEHDVPLFDSGAHACEHGKADIDNPSEEAMEVVARLMTKYERLR